jgi:hypothetical protein
VFPHQHGARVAVASQECSQVSIQATPMEAADSARAGLIL